MQSLGASWNVDDNLFNVCERLLCLFIVLITMMNDIRYQLFSTKGTQLHLLPPTRDALYKHLLRANYQARIWRNALKGMAEIRTLQGHGWLSKDGALTIEWMDALPAPFAVLELMSCRCIKQCEGNMCSCRRHQLPCTYACYCSDDCKNQSGEKKTFC